MKNELELFFGFPSIIYQADRPEFFGVMRDVSMEYLAKSECCGAPQEHLVRMTADMAQDTRVQPFAQHVAINSLNILGDQGYRVDNKSAYFAAMWCHEYKQHAIMEQHTHPGCKIVGFYFLDVPDHFLARFYDPRAGKVASGIEERNVNELTPASNIVDLVPKRGQLILTNSWLPHSFTRVVGEAQARFIHFNIDLMDSPSSAEVV